MDCILFFKYLLRLISFVLEFCELFLPMHVSSFRHVIVFVPVQSNTKSDLGWSLACDTDVQIVPNIPVRSQAQAGHCILSPYWEWSQY